MNGQGQLRRTLNIRERPAEANDRAVPGHWEGDLLFGKRMRAMATLVERQTRFVMLIALPNGHGADVVAAALAAKITELPEQLCRSLDQGKSWPTTLGSPSIPACRPISAIRAALGSGEATRTPTAYDGSTSPNVPRSPTTPRPTSTPSPPSSTAGLDKHSDGDHHHKHSTKRCDDHVNSQPDPRSSNRRSAVRTAWDGSRASGGCSGDP
jgi:hypothetical protein